MLLRANSRKFWVAPHIAYSDCVFVDLGIQHAMCIRHIVICGLPVYSIFPH